jgi:hypothetical protein
MISFLYVLFFQVVYNLYMFLFYILLLLKNVLKLHLIVLMLVKRVISLC